MCIYLCTYIQLCIGVLVYVNAVGGNMNKTQLTCWAILIRLTLIVIQLHCILMLKANYALTASGRLRIYRKWSRYITYFSFEIFIILFEKFHLN